LGGGYTDRPNARDRNIGMPKTRLEWFDTTDFSAPTPVWDGGISLGFGNSGKDAIVGPGRVNFTTSLYKSFQIYDTARFELRFESFNTANHTEWNGINSTMNNGNYGQVTGTWDPRALELGGKFVF
jgi:hypothetical protein